VEVVHRLERTRLERGVEGFVGGGGHGGKLLGNGGPGTAGRERRAGNGGGDLRTEVGQSSPP
jgi:hypothetical protein